MHGIIWYIITWNVNYVLVSLYTTIQSFVSVRLFIFFNIYMFVCLFKDALNWPKEIKMLPTTIIIIFAELSVPNQHIRKMKDHDTGEWSNDAEDSDLPSQE